ncbi:MAG TPA: cobaltochelatase subunit CobN [Rhodocyclaceae bacterium]|nr:cobaltochelatase subunit CobN [Rhodocyclaceae bacterium]
MTSETLNPSRARDGHREGPAARARSAALGILVLCVVVIAGLFARLGSATPVGAEPRVAVITSDFVLAGKFDAVRAAAAESSLELAVANIDRDDGATLAAALAGARLAILDAPREEDARRMLEVVRARLEDEQLPWLLVAARGAQAGGGLAEGDVATLYDYYRNGGERNFASLFAFVAARLAGASTDAIAPPIVFPDSGFYHPDHPDLVVPDLASYRAWLGDEGAARRPVVGIVIHQAFIGNLGTAHIDALMRRLEAAGALPLTFYHPTTAGAGALDLVLDDGRAAVDVLINFQVMYQGARRDDYARLDVPVLQAMTWRTGDADDWRASEVGVPMSGVPFYLAMPEYAGLTDPLVVAAVEDERVVLIPEQADALVAKALKLARLRGKDNADKRVALMFWNYPSGEKNLAASFMNVPASLAHLTDALAAAGYRVDTLAEDAMIERTTALLAPFYRADRLDALVERDLAARLPLADYLAWFDALPAAVRERVITHWGDPADDPMLSGPPDARHFVVPRLALGNLVILPQPPRGRAGEPAEKAIYHDTRVPLTHFYMAAYLYARQRFDADALIHFGTHGSQEWTPGKERGLSIYDDPYLVLGDVPVIYPYIVDNIGEATQAKRRGRATIISHQTPSFAPAGLHEALMPLHDLLHEYALLDEGAVKERTIAAIIAEATARNFLDDLGWTAERARADFVAFERVLHDWLHTLAQSAQPLGLHTFGQAPKPEHRLTTTMRMLGSRLYDALELDEPDELFVDDYTTLAQTPPYRLLARHLIDGGPIELADAAHHELLAEARAHFDALSAAGEYAGLLAALDARYIETHYGGDPIRNPESLPTGRNLYGFDPSRLPTEQAWAAGGTAFAELLAAHRAEHGSEMRKVAFSLWSVEAMRHLGVLEAQVFHALGVRPVWDRFGRISDTEVIPREELGRPRVDVVVSATGLYRDHFPNVMHLIAQAVEKVAALDEPDNAVRENTLSLEARLLAQGYGPEDAREYALTRIFSSESGAYGTGLDDATLASDTWDDEARLAELYLARMQYAYGPTESRWGRKADGVNLYAAQLEGVEAAVLARSSNLYGMLTTDDPFQYLGGIGLAVRHLTGASPSLYISNLRDAERGKVESAARFLAGELRARYFHPQWLSAMQAEGYAGTLNVVDTVNNFWGWTSVAPEIVRDDQWQGFFDVYVEDSLGLGVREWFEAHNPTALAQVVERMLEAARKGYWDASAQTLKRLVELYADAVERLDYRPASSLVDPYVRELAAGFGLDLAGAPPPPEDAAAQAPEQPSAEQVTGQTLEQVEAPPAVPRSWWVDLLLAGLTLIAFVGGTVRQRGLPLSGAAGKAPS